MEKVKVNVQVVKMRKPVREAKVLLVRKCIRQIKQLMNKRSSREELDKNQRKITRLCKEINVIKHKPIDDVSRKALAKDEPWDEICKQKEDSLERKVEARLAGHPKVQKCVQHFRNKNPQWELWVPSVLQVWQSQHVMQLTGGEKSKIVRRKEAPKGETQQNNLKQEEGDEEKLLPDKPRPSREDVESSVTNVSSGCTYSNGKDTKESDSNSEISLSLKKDTGEDNEQRKHPRRQHEEGNVRSKYRKSNKNKSKHESNSKINKNNAKHEKKTDFKDSGERVDEIKTENTEVAEYNIEPLLTTEQKLKTVLGSDETKNEGGNSEHENNPKIGRKRKRSKKKVERGGVKPCKVKRSLVKILPKCEGSLTIAPVNLDELQDQEEIVLKKSKEAEDVSIGNEETCDDQEGTHHDAFFLGGLQKMEEVSSDMETENYEHPVNQNFKSKFISSLSRGKGRNRVFEKQVGFRSRRGFGNSRGTTRAVSASSTLRHRGRFIERESNRRDTGKQHPGKRNHPSKVFSPWEKSSSYEKNREKAMSQVPTNQVLHPSWEAKMKLKDKQNQLVAFQGKKIRFDDE